MFFMVYFISSLPSVAKLDIATDSDSGGRGFESLRVDQAEPVRNSRPGLGFFFCLAARVYSGYLFRQRFPLG